jgi:hypothetical protein
MTAHTPKPRRCADCRDGEHDNYDDDVRLVVVRNPDTNRLVKRAYMCKEHRTMYGDEVSGDGYDVTVLRAW